MRRSPGNGWRVVRLIMKAATVDEVKALYKDFMSATRRTDEIDVMAAIFTLALNQRKRPALHLTVTDNNRGKTGWDISAPNWALPGSRFLAMLQTAWAADAPQIEVDPFWPKTLPNNWMIGQVGGIFVYSQDHVWINHRPRTLEERETRATCAANV